MLGISIGKVRGYSMMPRIPPDSFVIAIKYPKFLLRTGQVYYLNHGNYGRIVKTLDKIDGGLWFRGESIASVSTESIGKIDAHQLIGRVFWVIKPKMKSLS